MVGVNDYLPMATDVGANVISQGAWAGLAGRTSGFSGGTAHSDQFNKAFRQATSIASMIGSFIASKNYNALDDGNLATLLARFTSAVGAEIQDSQENFAVATGLNDLVATLVPTPPDPLPNGFRLWLFVETTNTAALRLNLNGTGLQPVRRRSWRGLEEVGAGDIIGSSFLALVRDTASSQWLIDPGPQPLIKQNFASLTVYFSGSGVFTTPNTVPGVGGLLHLFQIGPGGGGAGANSFLGYGGGGGGGGGCTDGFITATPGQTFAYAVGVGGTAGPASTTGSQTAAGNGTATSFGANTAQPGTGTNSALPGLAGGATGGGIGISRVGSAGVPGQYTTSAGVPARGGTGGCCGMGSGGGAPTAGTGENGGNYGGGGAGGTLDGSGGTAYDGGHGNDGLIVVAY